MRRKYTTPPAKSSSAPALEQAIMGPGATAPGKDWLFAEGYTGAGFQEYYELANFGTTAANAQIKLEYTNGSTQTVAVQVPALGFIEFDVNAHPGASASVSAEVTSDNPIVAERMMYFHFGPNHISGATDVVKIKEDKLNQIYQFDANLLDEVNDITNSCSEMENNSKASLDIKPSMEKTADMLDNLIRQFDERENVLTNL